MCEKGSVDNPSEIQSQSNITRSNSSGRKRGHWTLVCLLVAAAFLNFALGKQVKTLREQIMYIKSERHLSEGDNVPNIVGRDVNGAPAEINIKERHMKTILYVFRPDCQWCERNLGNLQELVLHLPNGYRLIGLSLSNEGLAKYVQEKRLSFPIHTELAFDVTAAYKLGATPQTIIISEDGKVLKQWRGAYVENTRQEVERYFGIQLPGLKEPEGKSAIAAVCEQ